jgi:anaerobic selenocysteine-containing dehydrogenase
MCVRGGSVLPGHMSPLVGHSDERNPKIWRTMASDIPAVGGIYPPNVFPEEVLSDGSDPIRALIVSASNPLRSYADTTAYEKAFARLELSVAVDLTMTETCRACDYVLPAHSPFESWDAPVFAWNYPEVFFQMRRPVVRPTGQTREPGDIFIDLAQRMGLLPDIPDYLENAAKSGSGAEFNLAMNRLLKDNPKTKSAAVLIAGKALAPLLGSVHLAGLKYLVNNNSPDFYENAVRAGFNPGDGLGDEVYQAILDNPQGVWIGRADGDNPMQELATEDGRVNLHIPELTGWLEDIQPQSEAKAMEPDPDYPHILMAGRHYPYTANSLLRHPGFKAGRKGELAMHPDDAEKLGLGDGDAVRITTQAGSVKGVVELDSGTRPGFVVAPHGFGLSYEGEEIGFNINYLTSAGHRDSMLGTPLHRYVPCRLDRV